MSDELNVWREAVYTYGGLSIEGTESEAKAAAVIRTYGDLRYQAAIDDVVKWLRERAAQDVSDASYCRSGNAGQTLRRFALRRRSDASEITCRFGKDA